MHFDIWGRLGRCRHGWEPAGASIRLGDEIGGWPSCCPECWIPGELPLNDTSCTIKRPHVFTIWKVLGLLRGFKAMCREVDLTFGDIKLNIWCFS